MKIPGPGKGNTHSRGRSTGAPVISSSVALAPLSKGVGTSEEMIEHIRLKCRLGTFSSGRRLQTKPNQTIGYHLKNNSATKGLSLKREDQKTLNI